MFDNLIAFISSIKQPSPELSGAIVSCLKYETLPKKTLLLKMGQVCDRLYFIEKGIVRAYYHKHNVEVTSWFMQENEMIISVHSFFQQKPALECIELLEDCTLVSIHYDDLQALYSRFPEFNHIGRVLAEKYYCMSEDRLMAMRLQSTQEKYDSLLKSSPQIFNRASLKHIASFLGMKPETISRLRAKH